MDASAPANARLTGKAIISELKASRIEYVLALPDIVTTAGVLEPISRDGDFKLVRVCKEDECVAIAAALSYADKRALVLIQHTGFLYATNALHKVAAEFRHPVCMMVGLLGHESDLPARESAQVGPRVTTSILDSMQIPYHQIGDDADVSCIRPAIDDAYASSHAVAILVGRTPRADGDAR